MFILIVNTLNNGELPMSFFSKLFGLNRGSRYSKHGGASKHGGYSNQGHSSKHSDHNNGYYNDKQQIEQQYRNVMQCQQCRSMIRYGDKFCSECGLPV
ncbi:MULTISPECIES: hypothetical protein [Providencia]|uniref:hypothetical protein n=1 Tax=Providencia TaxID=586 RepID=UPI002349828C|nr:MULTISPECIES: hypothetical protein [Providencia]